MSGERHIAAFDSGLGGLSALAPLLLKSSERKLGHQLNYLGDLANLPYGSKSSTRVRQLSAANFRYLVDESLNPKPELLIIACNTVSAFALQDAQELCATKSIACVDVIEPSCQQALSLNPTRILVLATKATVESSSYQNCLRRLGYNQEIVSVACPLFVPFVEEGVTDGPAIQWVVQKYLAPVARPGDLAILGCTHYPFLLSALQKEFPYLQFVQAGEALLNNKLVQKVLAAKPAPIVQNPRLELQFTDDPDEAGKLHRFLNYLNLKKNFSIDVRKVAPLI